MKIRRKIKWSIYVLLLSITSILFFTSYYKRRYEIPTIGIFLSSNHPNYQKCCLHFCSSNNLSSYQTLILNSENSVKKARKIAKHFHSKNKIKAVFTVGALATKTMSQIETRKPIVFSAVQNASALSFYKKCKNIYGIEDRLNIDQLIFISKAINEEIESCLCIYSEEQEFFKTFRKDVKNHYSLSGINFEEYSVKSSRLEEKIASLARKSHIIFIPLESFDKNLLKNVLDAANKNHIPVITTDSSLLETGICAGCSIDYRESGTIASLIMEHLLYPQEDKQAKIAEISFSPLSQYITFNEEVMEKLNIKLNNSKKKQIKFLSKHRE